MTLRDLTRLQLYNLQRKCASLRKKYIALYKEGTRQLTPDLIWDYAFNQGLKAGLELKDKQK